MAEDILRFEIPMEETIAMKVCKTLCNFIEDAFYLGFCKFPAGFLSAGIHLQQIGL